MQSNDDPDFDKLDLDKPDLDLTVQPSDTLNRLRDWFDTAIEMPPASREAWISANIANSDDRVALRRLLNADDDAGFLDTPAVEYAARLDPDLSPTAGLIGQEIGGFRLTRALGQGGMAAVFLGERVGKDFVQHAAIKLLRRGLYSELEQRLFLRERQVLAALDHPNIARLIDGGVTEAGIPYLVMEYVDGVPITLYAYARELSVRQCLELFLAVCRAVEAAHQNLVVHRDIKPSNILVAANGDVKLLDFGIAKLLEEDTANATAGTVGIFTPGYAAPEQMNGGAITTATDVFGLGVLLHELLLGLKPDTAADSGPRRPSSRVDDVVTTRPDGTPHSQSAEQLRRQLRGDLDNIVLKALEAEPGRRYASAGAFADDIERHLNGRPVVAHPPTRWYRTQKFIQRHRGGVTVTAILVLAVFASLGLALWQAQMARHEAMRANDVRDFLVRLFTASEIGLPRTEAPSTRTLLQDAGSRIGRELQDAPDLRIELMDLIGTIQTDMSLFDDAEPLLRSAAENADKVLSRADSRWIDAQIALAHLRVGQGRYGEAIELLRRGMEGAGAQVSAPTMIHALLDLAQAQAFADQRDDAETSLRSARQLLAGTPDPLQHLQLALLKREADNAMSAHRFADALDRRRQVLTLAQAQYGDKNMEAVEARFNVAATLLQTGQYAQAEALDLECIRLYESLYEKTSDFLLNALNDLASAQLYQNHLSDAAATYEQALDLARRNLPEYRLIGTLLHNLANVEIKNNHPEKALALAQESLAFNRKRFGENHRTVANNLRSIGIAQGMLGRNDEALQNLEQSNTMLAKTDSSDPTIANNRVAMADIEMHRHNDRVALALLEEATPQLRKARGDRHPFAINARVMLARARIKLGKVDITLGDLAELETVTRNGDDALRTLLPAVLVECGRAELALKHREAAIGKLSEALRLQNAANTWSADRVAELRNLIGEAERLPESVAQ